MFCCSYFSMIVLWMWYCQATVSIFLFFSLNKIKSSKSEQSKKQNNVMRCCDSPPEWKQICVHSNHTRTQTHITSSATQESQKKENYFFTRCFYIFNRAEGNTHTHTHTHTHTQMRWNKISKISETYISKIFMGLQWKTKKCCSLPLGGTRLHSTVCWAASSETL